MTDPPEGYVGAPGARRFRIRHPERCTHPLKPAHLANPQPAPVTLGQVKAALRDYTPNTTPQRTREWGEEMARILDAGGFQNIPRFLYEPGPPPEREPVMDFNRNAPIGHRPPVCGCFVCAAGKG